MQRRCAKAGRFSIYFCFPHAAPILLYDNSSLAASAIYNSYSGCVLIVVEDINVNIRDLLGYALHRDRIDFGPNRIRLLNLTMPEECLATLQPGFFLAAPRLSPRRPLAGRPVLLIPPSTAPHPSGQGTFLGSPRFHATTPRLPVGFAGTPPLTFLRERPFS